MLVYWSWYFLDLLNFSVFILLVQTKVRYSLVFFTSECTKYNELNEFGDHCIVLEIVTEPYNSSSLRLITSHVL